jgi:hypothetical protein
MKKANPRCGNAGPWKERKTKRRFPSLSTALGNRCRDSHIPTAPTSAAVSLKIKTERTPPLIRLHLARSGSSFDEKMLCAPAK